MAVALANASLLGVGYLMLRRRGLAARAVLVSVLLVVLLASAARSVWFECVVLLWWGLPVVHGWVLAGREGAPEGRAWGQRLVALGVTVPVLLVVGVLRLDASRAGESIAKARKDGNCARVEAAQRRVWVGDRVADAPLAARGDEAVRACRRLGKAKARLTTALGGDTRALKAGFDIIESVLAEPGNGPIVQPVLDGFLSGLTFGRSCPSVTVIDWLRTRHAGGNALDRARGVATRTAPAALAGCGAEHLAAERWEEARTHYRRLLDQYPGDALTAQARDGVTRATQAIELANVRELLRDSDDTQPQYCSAPAKYSGAPPYRKGTNRALFVGNDEYTDMLPGRWRTTDAAHAVLVVCAGETSYGASVETCPYITEEDPVAHVQVKFRRVAIPLKVYELRTGRLVAHPKVQIDGRSCPQRITFDIAPLDGSRTDEYVRPSKGDVSDAFSSLIVR